MAASPTPDRDGSCGENREVADGNCGENREVADAAAPPSRGEQLAALFANAGTDRSEDEIQKLRRERTRLNAEKRALSKQLKNECRKRSRMLTRSAQLSNEDLVEVIHIRQARAVAKAKAAAASNP